MSNASDFIIENGVLKEYSGPGGDVIVPEGITTIGWEVFSDARFRDFDEHPKVTTVVLPEGVESIEANAFALCEQLTKVVLPRSLKRIGSYAFNDCVALKELTIPENVTEIGDRAFAGCKKLEITLPPKLKSIEDAAFRGCAMKSIIIPEGVDKVGKDAFKNCSKIKTAGPAGGGYDYEFHWTEEIPDNAFSGLKKLKEAVLPATVKKVGGNAFKDCKELTTLTMPQTAKVHKTAFKGCDKLTDIKEPPADGAIPEIAKGSKQDSDFLITNNRLVQYRGKSENVIIPDGVTVIGSKVFQDMPFISSITIPASVTAIEEEALNCGCLEAVHILGTIEKVGATAFGWIHKTVLDAQVYPVIPIRAFSTSKFGGQDHAFTYFCEHISEFDSASEVYRDNIRFIGSHLKQTTKFTKELYVLSIVKSDILLNALLNEDAIPVKDIDDLVSMLQEHSQTVAALLDYKNRILQDPKARKSLDKAEERAIEKAMSPKMTVADWRKIFKFSYEGSDVVIKQVLSDDTSITVPSMIGTKAVTAIGWNAFSFRGNRKSPEIIIFSEGIREIRRGAFDVVHGSEIFFPTTVTTLPQHCFMGVHNLVLHLPATVTQIDQELTLYCREPAIAAIHAPAGSYAETYAKENNIPFVAE